MESEEVLTGGNVASLVVRVGETVRKPPVAAVEAVLRHLEGFAGAPRGLVRAGGDIKVDAAQLRVFVDAYGLDLAERQVFPARMAARTWASYELLVRGHETGEQPWARLYAEGHGEVWRRAAAYVEEHHDVWLDALVLG